MKLVADKKISFLTSVTTKTQSRNKLVSTITLLKDVNFKTKLSMPRAKTSLAEAP